MLHKTNRRQTRKSEGSWAISYVDMLTLLLCFFIIFYNSTKQNGKNEIIIGNNKTLKLTKELNNSNNTSKEVAILNDINQLVSDVNQSKIEQKKGSLEIQFENLSFFKSGKTEITPEAKLSIIDVIKILKPKKDVIKIIVQGHTDPTKTKKNTSYSDNWELSAIRATSVLKLFIQNGFPQENLSAEGFADTKTTRSVSSLDREYLAKQRKITLRIEPVRSME